MARRQLEIAGTRNDKDVPIAVVEAGQTWLERRREQRRAREKTAESLAGVIALMEASKIEVYKVVDTETGEKLNLNIRRKVTLTATRDRDGAGEEFEIGDGVDDFSSAPGPHPNLIAMAEADNAAAGLEVNDEGDVAVPDKAAAKTKRKAKKKGAKATDGKDDEADPVITTANGDKRRVPKRGGKR